MKSVRGSAIPIAVVMFVMATFLSEVIAQRGLSDKTAVVKLFAAWNSRDADKFASQFTSDALYEDVAAGHVTHGRDGVRQWASGAFRDIENFRIQVVSTRVHDRHGAVEWIWSGTDKGLFGTGKDFSVRGASIIQIRDGKISSYREYYDFSAVMRQLGLLPSEKK
jgi:steroid delta-isomerase-like uncharacterized protein